MQLCVFNGSPRGRKGNTSIILGSFLRGFTMYPGNSYDIYYLNRVKETETHIRAFKDAEAVLLAHPLYTDAMPALSPLSSSRSRGSSCGAACALTSATATSASASCILAS